jgi:DNA-3-methyladenine glycosylase
MARTLRLAPEWRATLLLRKDLPAGTLALAPFLIGKLLIHVSPDGIVGGRIVESEAYPPGDAAGHGYRGLTPSNRSLFLDHGHVYIYRAYGSAWMLNLSSETAGVGAGVLIRAIEPLVGLEIMRAHRAQAKPRDLARGPGRLAAALGIDLAIDGTRVGGRGPILLANDGFKADVGHSVRIGINRNTEPRWRYFERGSAFLSGPRRLNA